MFCLGCSKGGSSAGGATFFYAGVPPQPSKGKDRSIAIPMA